MLASLLDPAPAVTVTTGATEVEAFKAEDEDFDVVDVPEELLDEDVLLRNAVRGVGGELA